MVAGSVFLSSEVARAQQTCPCSIWSAAATPAAVANDTAALELGVKFRADVDGVLTGIRFYKYAANTGLHIANLWTTGGALLATVTFTSETVSGWQQANFAAPIPITAATTYVASYHTSKGSDGFTGSGLATSTDNGPLHALSSSAAGGNGGHR